MQQTAYPGAKSSMVTFGDRVEAFLAIPERGTPPFGAVILGHERYGLVQHTLDLAAKFAGDGYVGLAPDMFSRWEGNKAALNRGDARASLSDADVRAYMGDSLDFLLGQGSLVDPRRIAAMGVCQSGSYPLLLNSVRPEIMANIVFYGGAGGNIWETDAERPEPYETVIERLTAPVLGVWGEKDHVVSVEDVRRLRASLEAHGKSYEFKLFPGMPHGWLNSTMPGRYCPTEAAQAWALVLDFLERVAGGAYPRDRIRWRFESDISPSYDFKKNVRLE